MADYTIKVLNLAELNLYSDFDIIRYFCADSGTDFAFEAGSFVRIVDGVDYPVDPTDFLVRVVNTVYVYSASSAFGKTLARHYRS